MITQSETGLSTPNYNDLKAAKQDFTKQLVAYRYNPSFDSYLGRISRDTSLPWTIAADDSVIVRAYNEDGTLYAESYSHGTAVWTSPVSVATTQYLGIAPKVVKNGSTWELYTLNSLGYIYRATSSDGITWGTATAYSTVQITDAPAFISVALGAFPLVYVVVQDATSESYSVLALDATTQYNTGIAWANSIYEFDAIDFKAAADDTTGTYSDTNARHCLVMAALLPSSYTYKTVDGLPVKQAQLTGGVVSFVVRPPLGARPLQVSRWYPVQTFDQWDADLQARKSAKLMATNSPMDSANNRDTLWLTSVAIDGDVNIDSSFSTISVAYYSTRDGKHWSQDRLVPLTSSLGMDNGDFKSAAIVRHGTYLYLVSVTALVVSLGCLEFNNTHSTLTLDLTNRVVEYSTTLSDVRSSRITLDNTDAVLWSTFLGSPGVVALVTKIGHPTTVQVSIEEVDNIIPSRDRPTEHIELVTRDRLSWMLDRSEAAHAIQWDNQLSALDTFTDINGEVDSGLAHTDTVKGTFGTANNTLIAKPKYRESIAFHTTGSGRVQDGHCAAVFQLPTPTSFGGTSASDSPTYGGVVFRAQDKDNLWAAWYNYWTGKIELVQRKSGSDTVVHSITPTSAFKTRADAGSTVGIRVEFRYGVIKVYESTVLYSAIGARYNPSYTYTVKNESTAFLQGYVGYVACGYSDQDSGDTTDPGPTILISSDANIWGAQDTSYIPPRLLVIDAAFRFHRVTGVRTTASVSTFTPSSGLVTSLGSCVGATQHPHNGNRIILLGTTGVGYIDNFWSGSPTFGDFGISPTAGYLFGWNYNTNRGVAENDCGLIPGSINIDGFFAWIEYPNAIGGTYRIRRTTDNFATSSSVAVTGAVMPSNSRFSANHPGPAGITLGCFATSVSNINIWFSPGAAFGVGCPIYRSTNGGLTWAVQNTYIMGNYGFQRSGGILSMPYSRPGGGKNTAYQNLWADLGDDDNGFIGGEYILGNGGTVYSTTGHGDDGNQKNRMLVTYTQDAKIALFGADTAKFTEDGGITWTEYVGPSDTIAGYPTVLNGCPINPYFYVGGHGALASWTANVKSNTSWNGVVNTSPYRVIQAFMDFTDLYSVGGVHP